MRTLKIAALAAAVLIQGCAFTEAVLDVKATPESKVAGPLGDLKSMNFNTPALDDARQEKARIGWKKNGYGQNTADIKTAQPVDSIIEDAVAKALRDTNHHVGAGGNVLVVGTVDRMWFDVDMNFWTVKFLGDVQATLDFVDSATQKSIYKSKYTGSYNDTKGGGLEKTWTVVMSKAVDKLIESIVLDDELVAALKKHAGSVGTQ
jgi:uncharacterized lipoprotein YajG